MYQQSVVVERKPVSGETAARLKRFIAKAKAARGDPGFMEAAKEFYRQHTGQELRVRADA